MKLWQVAFTCLRRKPLRPRAELPHLDSVEHHAWREGWFQGIAVGVVLGICIALILRAA